MSQKSGSSGGDSSRDVASSGGEKEYLAQAKSEQHRLSTQRSLNTDTMEMSEDSFNMGDTSGLLKLFWMFLIPCKRFGKKQLKYALLQDVGYKSI